MRLTDLLGASYEYLFAWSLRLDGTMELEIKLTGILNLYVSAEGEKVGAFGTEVAPRVNAHHHQREQESRSDSVPMKPILIFIPQTQTSSASVSTRWWMV